MASSSCWCCTAARLSAAVFCDVVRLVYFGGMKIRSYPSQAYLREAITMTEAGLMTWNHRPNHHFKGQARSWNARRAGTPVSVALSKNESGRLYRMVPLNGTKWMYNRILWTYFNGDIPKGMQVDHINGDSLDDRLDNYRLATHAQNVHNSKLRAGASGLPGANRVSNKYSKKKWSSAILINGKRVFLGYFETPEEASKCYLKKVSETRGEFASQRCSSSASLPADAEAKILL